MAEDILSVIAARTRERVAQDISRVPREEIAERARALATAGLSARAQGSGFAFPFRAALEAPGLSFICEVKRASPSKGVIAEEFPYRDIARDYERAGASAISCLTEPHWFGGADAYLEEIARTVACPVLRKDFVVDDYMIYQAKVLGASAVLLICSILDDEQLASYAALATQLGLSALVEAHDEREISRALAAGASIVGVNNRNLRDFSVDFDNARRLRELVPESVVYVAESGVSCAADVADIARLGADAVLVGEALMRADDRPALLAGFRQAAEDAAHGEDALATGPLTAEGAAHNAGSLAAGSQTTGACETARAADGHHAKAGACACGEPR